MTRPTSVLAFGAVGIISLIAFAGCNRSPEVNISQASPAATASTPAATTDGFDGLKAVITNTRSAVEAGDFAAASSEFEQFETYWKQVEDGIKDEMPDTYEAIETNMDEISGGLKASQPNQEEVLAALQSLETNVDGATN
ncbi:MAG: hypothetical protein VKK04_17525 [Synechococcales bacterium]|nr:hypothetical protein [Synechococcales bacterium]